MGSPNTGKSCVLKKLWDLIPGEIVEIFNKKAPYNVTGLKRAELTNIGMCTVGDITDGDTLESIQSGLALMVKLNCEIIVCACHTRKQFFKSIENLGNTLLNDRLLSVGITKDELLVIKQKIEKEYRIIGCGHFCDWNIEPVSISTSHKMNAIVGGVDLTEMSAKNILTLINSLK